MLVCKCESMVTPYMSRGSSFSTASLLLAVGDGVRVSYLGSSSSGGMLIKTTVGDGFWDSSSWVIFLRHDAPSRQTNTRRHEQAVKSRIRPGPTLVERSKYCSDVLLRNLLTLLSLTRDTCGGLPCKPCKVVPLNDPALVRMSVNVYDAAQAHVHR